MSKILFAVLACCAFDAGARQMEDDDRRRRGDDIQLVCFGEAEKPTVENRAGYTWNPERHRYEPTSDIVGGRRDFDTALNVSIHDDQGRIRIPTRLIPPLHSGGSDGWWDIEDLRVGHDDIRGRFRLNGLNRPSLTIDRRSGAIVVDGLIKFNGRCEPDGGHRRF